MQRGKTIAAATIAVSCAFVVLLAVGCSPQRGSSTTSTSTSTATASTGTGLNTYAASSPYAADEPSAPTDASGAGTDSQSTTYSSEKYIEDNTPKVTTLTDGTQIQLVPNDIGVSAYRGLDFMPSYNLHYLHADKRGCNSCHADLAQTVSNMTDYDHEDLTRCAPTQLTVQQCVDCHTWQLAYISEQNAFGDMIHQIHYTNHGDAFTSESGNCWSCHYVMSNGPTSFTQQSSAPGTTYAVEDSANTGVTASSSEWQLWDVVKHSVMRGITDIPDQTAVNGSFTWNQDKSAWNQPWDYNWRGPGYYWDHDRYHYQEEGVPLDQKVFDNWTITVSGCVGKEVTFTLPELLAKAPSVDTTKGLMCTMNPTGGPFFGNFQIKAIPLSWLVEQAGGYTDQAASLQVMAADGSHEDLTRDVFTQNMNEIYIVYQISGEPLRWESGYPVWCWCPFMSAGNSWKSVSDFVFSDTASAWLPNQNGWHKQGPEWTMDGNERSNSDGFFNKPNVGYLNVKEGTVIKTGQPYTINGFAHAFDLTVAAVEFSLDGGKTWTRYDTPGVDHTRIVNWSFTFTPPADSSYVVRVRSVTTDGLVTETPQELMLVAHSS